jgi:hypothetical protein
MELESLFVAKKSFSGWLVRRGILFADGERLRFTQAFAFGISCLPCTRGLLPIASTQLGLVKSLPAPLFHGPVWSRVVRCCALILFISCSILDPGVLNAELVQVRHIEGVTHGFLVLRSENGEVVADGDMRQEVRGDRVTNHITFRFKDGSLHDEVTIYTQRREFRLLSDKLVQQGPSFKHPGETTVDTSTGQVTIRSNEKGKDKVVTQRMQLPPDLANGLIFTLLKNIPPDAAQTTVSMLSGSSKPRIVKLHIAPQGEDAISWGAIRYKGLRYVIKFDITGVAGVVAPLVGKQPPDMHAWILQGEAPSFIRSEGPLAEDGPIWRIDLTAPNIKD